MAHGFLSRQLQRAQAPVQVAVTLIVALLWLTGCAFLGPSPFATAPADFQAGVVAVETPVARGGATGPATTITPTPARLPAGLKLATPLPGDRLPTIRFDRLPVEARDVLRLIGRGGPFPYRQDGAVFQNRERVLPNKQGGYYHEYTVETPGSADRGARRIITGRQGEIYYTDDHYASFRRVTP